MQINPAQLHPVRPLKPTLNSREQAVENARDLKNAYRDFVGKTFYGQMLKAMRTTVGKPAYFYGGQTEEVFRSQLDQQLADRMTEATADQLADPMFRLQFPAQAELLAAEESTAAANLSDLGGLRRR